jgi:hypothetical protein
MCINEARTVVIWWQKQNVLGNQSLRLQCCHCDNEEYRVAQKVGEMWKGTEVSLKGGVAFA